MKECERSMLSRRKWWGPPEEDEEVATLIGFAEIDWMDIGNLSYDVWRRLPEDAALEERIAALGELAGVLIDHGVVPGDLGAEPDLVPWPGTRDERVERIVREARALQRMPETTEIAWFLYLPDHDPRSAGRGDTG